MKFVLAIIAFQVVTTAAKQACTTKAGQSGVCESISDCPFLLDLLNSGDLSDLTTCDSDGSVGIFCCPQTNFTQIANSKSCQRIVDLRDQLKPELSEYKSNSTTASVGEVPFVAQIFLAEKGFVGVGALISERFVLTAAHVVYRRLSLPSVRLGKVIKALTFESLLI